MREQIVVKGLTQSSDGMGGYTTVEATILTCFAKVEVPRSKSGIVSMADAEIRTHVFTTRYNSSVNIGHYVVYDGGNYPIRGITHDGRKRFMSLECVPEAA